MKSILSFLLLFSLLASPLFAQEESFKIGLQTWTLRNYKFDQVVEFAVKHKIKNLQLIPSHINPLGPMEEIKAKKEILDKNGLVCYTVGVVETFLEKEKNRPLFEFAKLMGCKVLIVEPRDFKILDHLEAFAKEYDVNVAIHNHGIKSLYGNPEVVKNLIQHRDRRMGVCLDTGHVTGSGFDVAKIFRDYDGRVYDIHLKDKTIEKVAQGDDVIKDVMIGTGQANFKGLFAELKKSKWNGVLAIETDNHQFAANPAGYVEEAVKFVKTTAAP